MGITRGSFDFPNTPTGKVMTDAGTWVEPSGEPGQQGGQSAYQIAVANGFVGDEAAWLASLKPSEAELVALIEPLIPEAAPSAPTTEELEAIIAPLIPEPVPGPPGNTPTNQELIDLITPLIPAPIPGEDGHTPTEQELTALIEPLIPEPGNVDLSAAWPIGSVFMSVVATNPGTLLGFGTWAAIGAGRMLVGRDANDTDFDTLEETGGAKTVTLTEAQMPSHTHVQNSHNHTQDAHTHIQNAHQHTGMTGSNTAATSGTNFTRGSGAQIATLATTNATAVNQNATATNQAATAVNQNTGGGQAHTNMPPYLVVNMWKRTA